MGCREQELGGVVIALSDAHLALSIFAGKKGMGSAPASTNPEPEVGAFL